MSDNIRIYPTEIEAHDAVGPVFKIKANDEFTATIEFSGLVCLTNWPEISAAIVESLEMMKLEGVE
jgi:hypothetical protein